MIVGVGIDVVDISRFAESLGRTPELRDRLFTPGESGLGIASLAARFAAKEAMAKALGAPGNMHWHDAEVVSEASGRPLMTMRGTVLARADRARASPRATCRCPTTPASRPPWWCWRADVATASPSGGGDGPRTATRARHLLAAASQSD